jgi:hypothetical protein
MMGPVGEEVVRMEMLTERLGASLPSRSTGTDPLAVRRSADERAGASKRSRRGR